MRVVEVMWRCLGEDPPSEDYHGHNVLLSGGSASWLRRGGSRGQCFNLLSRIFFVMNFQEKVVGKDQLQGRKKKLTKGEFKRMCKSLGLMKRGKQNCPNQDASASVGLEHSAAVPALIPTNPNFIYKPREKD